MTRRVGVALAIASLLAGLQGCIETPTLIPLEEDADAGEGLAAPDGGVILGDAAGSAEEAGNGPPAGAAACAARCPSAGGTCDGDTCVITCSESSPCKGSKKCPPGLACRIVCDGKHACDKVDCVSSSSCSIRCTGEQACNGDVRADAPATDIACDGYQACNGKVECKGASCAISCAGLGCKPGELRCCANQCTVNGVPAGCKPS